MADRIFVGMNATQTTNTISTTTRWSVDSLDTTVGFSIRHFMVTNVRGLFEKVQGTVHYDSRRPEDTMVDVTILVASVSTRDARRDAHLRDPDFFDVEQFPTMTYRSKRVVVRADGSLELTGDPSLRGVTRPLLLIVDEVTKPQKDHNGVPRMGATANGTILRSEFGTTYNLLLDAGGLALADEMSLSIDPCLLKTVGR